MFATLFSKWLLCLGYAKPKSVWNESAAHRLTYSKIAVCRPAARRASSAVMHSSIPLATGSAPMTSASAASSSRFLVMAPRGALSGPRSPTPNGAYSFNHLAAGNYRVVEWTPWGSVQTGPTVGNGYAIKLVNGQTSSANDFDNFQRPQDGKVTNVVYTVVHNGVSRHLRQSRRPHACGGYGHRELHGRREIAAGDLVAGQLHRGRQNLQRQDAQPGRPRRFAKRHVRPRPAQLDGHDSQQQLPDLLRDRQGHRPLRPARSNISYEDQNRVIGRDAGAVAARPSPWAPSRATSSTTSMATARSTAAIPASAASPSPSPAPMTSATLSPSRPAPIPSGNFSFAALRPEPMRSRNPCRPTSTPRPTSSARLAAS